jgi:chorismate-pyruvate lyase
MEPVTLSGLELALGRTAGTVTAFLEERMGEPIEAGDRRHATIEVGAPNSLGVHPGSSLLKRTVVLRGSRSASPYVYAESLLVPGSLPAVFFKRLETSADPIGRILTEECIAFTRVPLPPPGPCPALVETGDEPASNRCILARRYRIDVAATPVMEIAEWFLSALDSESLPRISTPPGSA